MQNKTYYSLSKYDQESLKHPYLPHLAFYTATIPRPKNYMSILRVKNYHGNLYNKSASIYFPYWCKSIDNVDVKGLFADTDFQ